MRPYVDRRERAQRRSNPVDDKVLHRGVTAASKLQRRGENGIEVAAARREGGADEARRDEAVDGGGVPGLLLGDEAGAEAAEEGGGALDERPVKDGHGEVGGADVVDG